MGSNQSEQSVHDGSLERPGGESPVARGAHPPGPVSLSPSGHSNDPPAVPHNVAFFRIKAEENGDLAAEMIQEGIEGTAYGAARKAAHYGIIANELYRQRSVELIAAHPEWLK